MSQFDGPPLSAFYIASSRKILALGNVCCNWGEVYRWRLRSKQVIKKLLRSASIAKPGRESRARENWNFPLESDGTKVHIPKLIQGQYVV